MTVKTIENPKPSTDPYWDLAGFQRKITTTSSETQTWFDRSLCWTYAFHTEEAALCAENALANDTSSPMAYWAIMMGYGPNYAKRWEIIPPPSRKEALERSAEIIPYMLKVASTTGTPVERALCQAVVVRFPKDMDGWDFDKLNTAYADAMAKVYEQFPDDLDVAATYADALMGITPWKLWDLRTGEPLPKSRAPVAEQVLERAIKQEGGDRHPGLLHMYIHLMEMTPNPERGIPAADKLFGLIPSASHLNHMPSHLDVLIGDYRRAIAANARAVLSDDLYINQTGEVSLWYSVLRMHNTQSLIYAAMGNGSYDWAMKFTDVIDRTLTDDFVRGFPELLEGSLGTRMHVWVRFGRWKEIIEWPFPKDKEYYCVTTAMMHYAKGVAYAATGRIKEAENERDALKKVIPTIPESRIIFPNKAAVVMEVGVAMLDGELEYRKQNYDVAFKHLKESIKRYDGLMYGEPWSWLQPVRHAYAALQLEQGNVQEALDTYAADLGYNDSLARAHQHPNNVWALHGYHECLEKLGRHDEAKIIYPQLRLALAVADVKVTSSCFCRLSKQKEIVVNGSGPKSKVNGDHCC